MAKIMKTLGIIGGLGPETTANFFMEVILSCAELNKLHRPSILIANVPIEFKLEENFIKHSKGKRNARRSHHALKKVSLAVCAKCQRAILPHRICQYCGNYKGKMEVDVLAKLDKKELKKRQKIEAAGGSVELLDVPLSS